MNVIVAESDRTGDLYYFKCNHEPSDCEFGWFIRDEYPDHFEKDEYDWDEDDGDDDDWYDSDSDDWDDEEDCGGTCFMTIIDIIEDVDDDATSVEYEDETIDISESKTIEGYL